LGKNEETKEVNGQCTFCKISKITIPVESYKHLFLECRHSREILKKSTDMFKIPLPNTDKKGELYYIFFHGKTNWNVLDYMYFTCFTSTILPHANTKTNY
jgi:hypothetical protein